MFPGGVRRPGTAAIVIVLALGLAACGGSTPTTPGNVAGFAVTHFESGFKSDAPTPDLDVKNAGDTEADKIAIATIDDVQTYWGQQLPANFDGFKFEPVGSLLSYDSDGQNQETGCGETKKLVNAFYCGRDDSVAWDRGVLLPMLLERFGPMSVVTVLAHELGHAVQFRLLDKAGIDRNTPTIVKEQQADCFAGNYFRWMAEDKSRYFKVSTSEGLNQVMASMYLIRDQAGASATDDGAHGTAFDRIFAFQLGFEKTPKDCAAIDIDQINSRITERPFDAGDSGEGQADIDAAAMAKLQQSLDQAFAGAGAQPPQIQNQGGSCSGGTSTPPASYCADSNTVSIDLAALAVLGRPADQQAEFEGKDPGGMGDFAAFAQVASRYALGVQKAVGASVDNTNAGLRTACLVGAWAEVTSKPNGKGMLRLSSADLDEAISDLLAPNGLVAADVNGKKVDSGFARVEAMRNGYIQGSKVCSTLYG